jgi:Cft2 family RNA processing exonuclease
MKAALTAISGLGAKGPACFLVETTDSRLLLDLGYGPQPGLWPDVSRVGRVDAVLLSHGHRDHAGGLKLLPDVGSPPVYATDIVRRGLPSDVTSASLPLRGVTDICGIRITTGRSGHAPGGVWLHLAIGGGLLYTGDYGVESAVYAWVPPPAAGTVILDASYGAYDVALADCAAALDAALASAAALLPVPPAGRGPEIALHLLRSGCPSPAIDDAMRTHLEALCGSAAECVRSGVHAPLSEIARTAPAINEPEGLMLAGAADAASGRAADLVAAWESRSTPAIVFTGYVPPDTPAERLTRSGRAIHRRWNVHPRLSDNAALVRSTHACQVLPAFGDRRHLDTWQSAFAPARVILGGTVTL